MHHAAVRGAALDDSNACTTDACAPTTGVVTHVAVDTNDADACTTDSCDVSTGVAHVPVNVNDNDACTTDTCAPATGVITHAPVNVDDNNACTTDSCDATTGVSHVAVSVDDSIACTTDACTPAGGVTHTPVHSTCEADGFTCTVAVCSTTTGCSETPSAVLCDDSVACTADSCVGAGGTATTGCLLTPRDLSCSAVETCSATGCAAAVAGAQLGNIVITEFRALGVEFIELYNPGTAAIDIHGFTLRNAADQRATVRDVGDRAAGVGTPVTLAPGAYAWGVANPAGAIVGSPHFVFGDQGTPFTFADSGDQLLVYDRTGRLEDAIDSARCTPTPGWR